MGWKTYSISGIMATIMTKYIVANWKSNKTITGAQSWLEQYLSETSNTIHHVKVIVAPAFHLLSVFADTNDTSLSLAVQDISPFAAGAYTGEVTASLLTGLSVKYAIVGHSERRRHFGETYTQVAQKVDQCLQNNITPIVCVDKAYVDQQAAALSKEHLEKCIVAYEPLAAIGSGWSEDVGTVQEVEKHVQAVFGEVPVIYGGSVDAADILDYTLVSSGVLVGSASLKIESFVEMVKKVEAALK